MSRNPSNRPLASSGVRRPRGLGDAPLVVGTATKVLRAQRRRHRRARQRYCRELADTDPQFAGIHFRPHDFRRLFATDLVNSGLPIHIGAALLGHLDLETTRGYVAVFE
ncbi:site-specific integrase [Rhodococcus sp. OK302]|uniref:site-specific integrase n=1 Tax=Rhodococcus sp. OK302 TaxID=1882769 RepID=UPI001C3D0C70|nr:site-specific integrase [Rhodococcus sp. OK302]